MTLPTSFGLARGWPAGPGRAPVLLQALTLSVAGFAVGASAGTPIGALGGTTPGSTLAVLPADPRVALTGASLSVGAQAATPGVFTIAVVETLPGALNSPRLTVLTLACTASAVVSAAVRARMPFVSSGGQAAAVGPNNVTQTRMREKTNVAAQGLWIEYANAYLNANIASAAQESGPGSPVTLRASLVTKLSGSGLSITGTVTPLTFNAAAAGQAGYAWNLDGSAATSAQAQARGAVSADGQTLTVPSGVYVRSDPAAVSLAAGEAYLVQVEEVKKAQQAATAASASGTTATVTVPDASGLQAGDTVRLAGFAPAGFNGDWPVTATGAGTISVTVATSGLAAATTNGTVSVLRVTYVEGRPDLGDAVKLAAGAAGTLVQTANWSGAAAATLGGPIAGVAAVFGQGPASARVAAVDGDSIVAEVGDWTSASQPYGDADGALAFANRALNAAGYSSVRTAVPGTKASQVNTYGGDALRQLVRRFASAVLCNHLHNDEGVQASGAAFIAAMQSYNRRLRQGLLAGSAKRVVNMSGTPATTSTDGWISDSGQTSASPASAYGYPNGWQYTGWLPYVMRTGSYAGQAFQASSGDPDAGYDSAAAVRSPVTGAWPTDGSTTKLNTVDGTHPSAAMHAQIAADLQPRLPQLLGF